ncbi:MAG: ABC transporter permease subunit [Steroidobacteraceae bacterium]
MTIDHPSLTLPNLTLERQGDGALIVTLSRPAKRDALNVETVAAMVEATWSHIIWQVKVPLAFPVMMLGLNQTILYGIATLVTAALVGASGLEQTVYIALTDGNVGQGLIAGLAMAIIAIITDRMTNGWSRKRQAALGLENR